MRSEQTIIIVEGEMPLMAAFAKRRSWQVTWKPSELRVLAAGTHPANGDKFLLRADVDGYKGYAPQWRFMLPDDENALDPRFPAAGGLPGGGGSIFHSSGVLCAPFNRLAYKKHEGPHNDWGGPELWLGVTGHTRATTLGEMLSEITVHLNCSPGWR